MLYEILIYIAPPLKKIFVSFSSKFIIDYTHKFLFILLWGWIFCWMFTYGLFGLLGFFFGNLMIPNWDHWDLLLVSSSFPIHPNNPNISIYIPIYQLLGSKYTNCLLRFLDVLCIPIPKPVFRCWKDSADLIGALEVALEQVWGRIQRPTGWWMEEKGMEKNGGETSSNICGFCFPIF